MSKTPRTRKKARPVRGALLAIAALFLASGIIRIVDGTGLALAREVEALAASGDSLDEPAEVPIAAECPDNEGLSRALETIRRRMAELDEREKRAEIHEVNLQRAEKEIKRNLAVVVDAEKSLASTIALADGAAEKDISRLTAVYEKMKPKELAEVFEAMDPTFAAGFLARMRPESAASVMAGLSPSKAYTVSILLAGRNANVPTE